MLPLHPTYFGLRSNNEGTHLCPLTENWTKDLLSMALPIRTRPNFPLSQAGSIRFISLSIRGPTERKPQSLKTNPTDHMTIALSTSMKLWAMSCRANQDWWVMVEHSDKTWSTGQRNGKPIWHSFLENTMRTSVQFNSVAQLYPTLCHPMNHSTLGLPVLHQILESTQTHVHWVGDAIQPSHPLLCPSPPALNLSQHQGLFQWVSCSHQVAKVLEFQLQHQSFQWTPRTDLL